jgi:DNA adenine methylase
MTDLRAPFPWFGAKSRVAEVIWRAFDPAVPNLVDPFCGSLATLLLRPGGAGKIETVNDDSAGICNFWRAITADPDAVARYCDWPVNETDLHARHKWLVRELVALKPKLEQEPEAFDAKIAGWWVWGACCWIGGGWCQEAKTTGEAYSPGRRPALAGEGQGVHLARKRPGVAAGVHVEANWDEATRLPSIGNDRGIFGVAAPPCKEWFLNLAARLRRVRVCCGDWTRVLGPGTLGKGRNVGGRRPCAVLLDPPYPHDHRDPNLYGEHDAADVWWAARDWAVEHGGDPELRIALCGYAGDFGEHPGWTEYAWRGARGYAAADNENRDQERIWFSRGCLPLVKAQGELFKRTG